MPFLMARSMVSFGMFCACALYMAVRRRALWLTSPPPARVETVISLISLVHSFDFFDEVASFLCLILDQRLWPDMAPFSYRFPAVADRVTSRGSAAAACGSRRAGDRRRAGRAADGRCARSS